MSRLHPLPVRPDAGLGIAGDAAGIKTPAQPDPSSLLVLLDRGMIVESDFKRQPAAARHRHHRQGEVEVALMIDLPPGIAGKMPHLRLHIVLVEDRIILGKQHGTGCKDCTDDPGDEVVKQIWFHGSLQN